MELRLLISMGIIALTALLLLALSARQRQRLKQQIAGTPTGSVQLLYFHGAGCGRCAAQSRYLDQLDTHYQSLVNRIDVEQNPDMAQRYAVLSLPTIVIVDCDGQVRHINNGLVRPDRLLGQLAELG